MQRKSIAVIARNADRRDSLTLNLRYENYEVQAPTDDFVSIEGLISAVDLAILDLESLKEARLAVRPAESDNEQTAATPLLLVLERDELGREKDLFKEGVEDYLVMPFNPVELGARVRNLLQRQERFPLLHPVSRLPSTSALDLQVSERLERREEFAAVFSELQNFKGFNDFYGYDRGDILIGATADVFKQIVNEHPSPHNFLAHGGGGDFAFLTSAELAGNICESIVDVFDEMVPGLYDPADGEVGTIITQDRRGKELEYPMVTISLAIVCNSWRSLVHPVQLRDIGKELLRYAKGFQQSCCVIDRRRV